MDRRAWGATVYRATKNQTQLSDLACTQAEKREKGRTWKIPGSKDKNEIEPTRAEEEQCGWDCKSQGRISRKKKGQKGQVL